LNGHRGAGTLENTTLQAPKRGIGLVRDEEPVVAVGISKLTPWGRLLSLRTHFQWVHRP